MGSCATRSENKMKLIEFLATIVLVSAKSIKIDQLEYGFCDGADTSVGSIDAADVQPFPVEVKTGASVTISATLTLNAVVQTGSTVSSTSLRRVSLICPFLALRSRDSTLDPAPMTLTTSSPSSLTSCVLLTSLTARPAPLPSTPAPTEEIPQLRSSSLRSPT